MMDLDRVNAYMARVEESETKTFQPVGSKLKVGLDLGTAYQFMVVLDEENNPIAWRSRRLQVLRDGVVVDYSGALRIVKELKAKLEERLGTELMNCAIAMPAGTEVQRQDPPVCGRGADSRSRTSWMSPPPPTRSTRSRMAWWWTSAAGPPALPS